MYIKLILHLETRINDKRGKINQNNNLSWINNGFLDTIACRIYLWLLSLVVLLKTRANNKFPIAVQTKSLINAIFSFPFFSPPYFQSSSILFFSSLLFIQHFEQDSFNNYLHTSFLGNWRIFGVPSR